MFCLLMTNEGGGVERDIHIFQDLHDWKSGPDNYRVNFAKFTDKPDDVSVKQTFWLLFLAS